MTNTNHFVLYIDPTNKYMYVYAIIFPFPEIWDDDPEERYQNKTHS